MDTVDLMVSTDKDILDFHWEQLRELKNINGIRFRKEGKIIILSFPRYFYYSSNTYLITKEDEVNEVLDNLVEAVELLGYEIIDICFLRIDYPFSFLRPEGESFESWKQIWAFIGVSSNISGWGCKSYSELEGAESYYFRNPNSKIRLTIYDQALKVKNSGRLERALKVFPDLKKRTRIEVSMKVRKNRQRFKGGILKEVKTRAMKALYKIIFRNIEEAKESSRLVITNLLKEWRKEKAHSFRVDTFIEANKHIIYDYVLLREAIISTYSNPKSAEAIYRKARKYLLELEERDGIKYFKNFKRLESLIKILEKEAIKKT